MASEKKESKSRTTVAIVIVGLVAVGAVIVWKTSQSSKPADATNAANASAMASGASVIGTQQPPIGGNPSPMACYQQ